MACDTGMAEQHRAPRVLVVEDDDRLVFAVREILEDAGYETRTAGDGHAAISRLSIFSPDVIVLDLVMPFVSGVEVLAWIKESGLRIPVVCTTCEDEVTARDLGVLVKLSKPFTQDELLEAVAAALKASKD